MKFHVTWTILFLALQPLAQAQNLDANLDLSDIDQLEEEIDTKDQRFRKKENLNDQSKRISLRQAIEEGLRKNSFQMVREYQREKIELNWKDQHSDFWFPQLSLSLQTEETLVDNLYTDVNSGPGTTKTPDGYIGLELDDYTLFNWGRDYLEYQNKKNTYKRQKQSLNEKRRQLRFNIISQYFNLARAKRILQIKRSQLRHTAFMYRLAKEKITLNKIKGQHYLQAKAEYLRSHTAYQNALYVVTEQENDMAELLGDTLSTSYTPVEQLKFVPLTTKKSESYKYALDRNPQFRQAQTDLENANRSFQKSLKDNMPLPKFDLKFGAFKHRFTPAGSYDQVGLENGTRNVELVASINMSWKIFGSGGLFNSRVQEKSYVNKRISEIEFREAKRNVSTRVNTYHRKIRFMEKQVQASLAFVKNARKTFDRTLDNYISGKTPFAEMKIVLDSLILSETQYENSKFQHMKTKLQLAYLMGIDDFPGENFEKMVMK